MIAALRGRAAALAGALACWSGVATGEEPPTAPPPLGFEASLGYESLSSPVVRIDPDSALILVEGTSRLRGSYGRLAVNAFKELPLGGEAMLVATARLDAKRAPRAPDLDFTIAQVDATLRHAFAGTSLGIGPTAGHVRVAGARFRDGVGVRADVAKPDGADGHWVVVADGGRHRHGSGYEDLDARVASASVHRRIATPFAGVSALDLEAGISRTANRHGYQDLSSRGRYARIAVESTVSGFDVAVALSGQSVRFDAGLADDVPARRERFTLVEIGASREFARDTTLRADFTVGRNRANLAIYDNRLRAFSVTLLAAY